MSSRAVSADPKKTSCYAREFLAGLGESRVLGCGKHFPGLGEGNLDSHHESAGDREALEKIVGTRTWRRSRNLRRELPFMMVSHAAYPAVTGERTPASLSKKWITDILRKKIGYRGLIASDDLEMGGVLSAAPIEQAAVEFVIAGGDLCLICHKEEFVTRSFEEIERAFADRTLCEAGR